MLDLRANPFIVVTASELDKPAAVIAVSVRLPFTAKVFPIVVTNRNYADSDQVAVINHGVDQPLHQ